jgi:hypothetical protein
MEDLNATPAPDARDTTAERLVFVHRQLLFGLDRLIAAPESHAVRELLPLYATILRGHHDGEEHFLFPALRAAGRMRSTDVAFLNARAHEHLAIVRLSEALLSEGMRHAAELRALLAVHFADEERGFSAERLREMIAGDELEAHSPPRADQTVVERFFGHPLIR